MAPPCSHTCCVSLCVACLRRASNLILFSCLFLKKKSFLNVYFLRERDRVQAEEGQRDREIQTLKQALSCQHRARCRAWSRGPRDRDLSWSWLLNRLSHPGAPSVWLLILARVMILGPWDQAPRQAQCWVWILLKFLSLSSCSSPPLALSLKKIFFNKTITKPGKFISL